MLSNLFYTINFSLAIVASTIGLIFCFLIIIIIFIDCQLHTIANLLTCNTVSTLIIYSILVLISSINGLYEDWYSHQPACIFRAYCYTMISATICYSYLIQAISRLFYVIFYKYKYLQTWRVHCIMVIINWVIGNIIPIIMLLMNSNAFGQEEESGLCIAISKLSLVSIFNVITSFVIPVSIVAIIYGIILYHARQSSRRVTGFVPRTNTFMSNTNIAKPNLKREIRLMKNIIIILSLLTCAGTPYLVRILLLAINEKMVPDYLDLLSINSITICAECLMVITFFMNKEVKNSFLAISSKFVGKSTVAIVLN